MEPAKPLPEPSEPAPGRLQRFADALDQRTGYRALLAAAGNEPVPGGARFAYVFGSALLFTFVLQAVTGITLASAYAPTTTDAWGSVYYIQNQMTLGWLVRGLHHWGSSAMIVLCLMHMTQVLLYGAYRKPREANWLMGCVMLLLVLGFGLTGYLLPWDQKGYWATQVATSIMGGTPGGEFIQTVLQGGPEYGNQTLTRFYAIHVFILPITLTLFIVGHVGLFRRHGVTPHPKRAPAELARKTQPFWPYQMLYDTLFAGVVLAILVAMAVLVGVSLEAPADPASGYEARPEWYFLFLFQLLKYFEGPMTLVGTVVIPGLAVAFLLAIPFIDRKRDGERWTRPPAKVLVPFLLLFGGAGALTLVAMRSDATDPAFLEARAQADAEAEQTARLAQLGGIDAQGRVVLAQGAQLFADKGCASCHAQDATAEDGAGPLLGGWGTALRVDAFLANPDHDRFFGKTVLKGGMEAWGGSAEDRATLARWLTSLSGDPDHAVPPEVTEAARALWDDGCTDCHNTPGVSHLAKAYDPTAIGPDLDGYMGFEWTRGLIRDATQHRYYGGALEADQVERSMPPFPDLTDDELSLMTRWLLAGAPGAD